MIKAGIDRKQEMIKFIRWHINFGILKVVGGFSYSYTLEENLAYYGRMHFGNDWREVLPLDEVKKLLMLV